MKRKSNKAKDKLKGKDMKRKERKNNMERKTTGE